ncbi:MAG: transposase [Planctomycetaceae bacterium]|nr:transposase [Planctomycetaceae bacterium]
MVMVAESVRTLKGFLALTGLEPLALAMVLRMVLAFVWHRGRMSCSAAGSIASSAVQRGELTRFLARPRWQKIDFNAPLRKALLAKEAGRGRFVFIVDATLVSQAGAKTQNTHCTGNRQRRPTKGRRYNAKKVVRKRCHTFTFGLLITPSGIRIPFQIPHYTKEYCRKQGITHRTTAESAAELIRGLPLPEGADVVVLGDTAYDADVVQQACRERGYVWIVPANPERVYEGPPGHRPQVRSRLKDWTRLSLNTIRLRMSTGKHAGYRRLSQWRLGPKQKPRVFYAHQERSVVRRVGDVQLVFSTMKQHLKTATPDDVKILMTNATGMSVTEVIELYSLRWQIELFFKELKSTLGFHQYRFQDFAAVRAWAEIALTTVLFLEYERAQHLTDRRVPPDPRRWWQSQRLHGLCSAFRQESAGRELKYLADRLKSAGGIQKLKRLLAAALPKEYRTPA